MTKITVDKTLIEQAIDAAFSPYCTQDLAILVPALRAALAEPAVEPFGYITEYSFGFKQSECVAKITKDKQPEHGFTRALYASPPPPAEPAVEPVAELVDYILQDDIHNRLTPRVVDIAYSAFVLGRSGTNSDDGGPCDWFNDTKPMVMEQIAKVKKDLAEEAAPLRKPSPPPPSAEVPMLTEEEVASEMHRALSSMSYSSEQAFMDGVLAGEKAVRQKAGLK